MIILTILTVFVCCWLLYQILRLSFKVAWGLTKFIAYGLCILALPALVLCVMTAGGIVLLLPIALLAAAFGIIKIG